ncbi:hypothetical protein ACFQ6N_01005 [Kitasatospora sp. NPDC056446]|uniref:hypothetical protein n=1 Tax=Kitasatospora sp. NPDC056446 TaxID=3345819 RepID=UPI0036A41F2A
MRNIVKPALALAALALATATTVAAPAASAAEQKPAAAPAAAAGRTHTDATANLDGVGVGTQLIPSLDSAWVHFLPTYDSEHLVVNRGHDIATVCWVSRGGEIWDLVLDHNLTYAGYTLESYLTNPSTTWCGSVGTAGTVTTQTWVHLYPRADWGYMVANPGDSVAPMCSVSRIDTDGQWHVFDLVVDRTNQIAGFAWDSVVTAPTPAAC